MDTIGAFEAKTHLSSLLERVAKGERIIITKHGTRWLSSSRWTNGTQSGSKQWYAGWKSSPAA